jgi:hypothetical protein
MSDVDDASLGRFWRPDLPAEWAAHILWHQPGLVDTIPPGLRRKLPRYTRGRAAAIRLGRDVVAELNEERERQLLPYQTGALRGPLGGSIR